MSAENKEAPIGLAVVGVYSDYEGYPNICYRLAALRKLSCIHMVEVRSSIGATFEKTKKNIVLSMFRFAYGHVSLFFKLAVARSRCKVDVIYIPYPSLFVVFLCKCIFPATPTVIDFFISVYDTAVVDRKLISARSFLARILLRVEGWSVAVASKAIVDTNENAGYYSSLFGLPVDKFVVSPLFTNEDTVIDSFPRKVTCDDRLKVLFVGSMVPLHGIDTILSAAKILSERLDIEFVLVGDGQDGYKVDEFISSGAGINIRWYRDWIAESEVASMIVQSDICLGVFSSELKAQRVCPFKMYLYGYIGKPIITGRTTWATSNPSGFLLTDCDSGKNLADTIEWLAINRDQLSFWGVEAKRFYSENLTNTIAMSKMLDCVKHLTAKVI